ncbi:MAG: 50S ribosomal protein L32e [Nitrososphaerales archaeon]
MSGLGSNSKSTAKTQQPSKQEIARLLGVRSKIKQRTPKFRRFESWRYVRIDEPWRKPKGIDNHMRLSVKGWPHLVKVGYRVPKQVRYLHPSGLRDVLVHNNAELEALSPSTDAARLAAGVGRRKKIELVKRSRELGIRVLNGRNLPVVTKNESESEDEESKTDEKRKSKR